MPPVATTPQRSLAPVAVLGSGSAWLDNQGCGDEGGHGVIFSPGEGALRVSTPKLRESWVVAAEAGAG